jgi:hypothetical protein
MTERPRTLAKSLSTTTLPPQLAAWRDPPKRIADPLADRVVRDVGPEERVLIVGAGLTAADLVAALDVPCLSRGRSRAARSAS